MDEQTNAQRGPNVEQLDAATLALLTTPIISDALDAVGLRHQVLDPGLVPLEAGARAIGRARTVQFAPTEADSADPYADAISFIDRLTSGSIAVIATGPDHRTAYWGELFSAAAIGRRAAGTICDGPVRDSPRVRALGYPVFAPGTRPIDFRARMRIVEVSQPVRCGGVVVAEGDLVVADADGIVVVPAAVEGGVLDLALTRATAESSVLAELLAGASLREVWDRWHVL